MGFLWWLLSTLTIGFLCFGLGSRYLSAVLVMLDRIDFETCSLILQHYDDLTKGRHALNLESWTDGDGVGSTPSFLSKIGEGAQAARAKQKALRAAHGGSRARISKHGPRGDPLDDPAVSMRLHTAMSM